MAEIINFPADETPCTVTLTGTEWVAIMLKLAGRDMSAVYRNALAVAEPKMLQQLKLEG